MRLSCICITIVLFAGSTQMLTAEALPPQSRPILHIFKPQQSTATCQIFRREIEGRLVPTGPKIKGTTPILLEPGSYHVTCRSNEPPNFVGSVDFEVTKEELPKNTSAVMPMSIQLTLRRIGPTAKVSNVVGTTEETNLQLSAGEYALIVAPVASAQVQGSGTSKGNDAQTLPGITLTAVPSPKHASDRLEYRLSIPPPTVSTGEVSIPRQEEVFVPMFRCSSPQEMTDQCRADYSKGTVQAVESCARAVLCSPEQADNHLRLAKVDYKDGDFSKALESVNIAIKLNPNEWNSFYLRSKIFFHNAVSDNQALDKAQQDSEQAIRLCRDKSAECADIHHVLGKVMAQKARSGDRLWSDWEEAIQQFSKAIAISQDSKLSMESLTEEYRDDLRNTCEEYARLAERENHAVDNDTRKRCSTARNR